jgi:hypothetical protein
VSARFWFRLAASFQSMAQEYGDRLAATYGSEWSFLGSPGKGELARFRALAERGALKLGCAARGEAVAFWLDALRAANPQGANGPLVSFADGRGGYVTVQHDLIEELCKASAEYCRHVAGEQERSETAGTDPGIMSKTQQGRSTRRRDRLL